MGHVVSMRSASRLLLSRGCGDAEMAPSSDVALMGRIVGGPQC